MSQKTYIADLTTEELQDLIYKTVAEAISAQRPQEYLKGIEGLMQIFHCSKSTAKRIKASGAIKKAIRQQGRTFITNVDLARQLYGSK
jgi:hypothetical protein